MSEKDLQDKLKVAINNSDYNIVIELLKQGAKVTEEMVLDAESRLQDLEIEYADDKALYAGRTTRYSDQDYTYRIVSRYAKGQKLDYIIDSMFSIKSKGEVITPKNKKELKKFMNKKRQYLGDIDISKVKDLSEIFRHIDRTNFDGIEKWDTSHIENMSDMFFDFDFTKLKKDNPLFRWIMNLDTSNVVDMTRMFAKTDGFDVDISNWDVSNVKYMGKMFAYSESFNQDISKWNTSNVECMLGMFDGAKSFDQNIDNWDTSGINKNFKCLEDDNFYGLDYFEDTEYYEELFHIEREERFDYKNFKDCPAKPKWLEQIPKENGKYRPKTKLALILLVRDKSISLSDIDISAISDLSSLFIYLERDWAGLEQWDTSHVENMAYMFACSKTFNHNIGMWNTSNVKNMESMFEETSFNQDIGGWDVSNVENMQLLFCKTPFNHDISNWNTSKVTNMRAMFHRAYEFNQYIGDWDVSNVTNMSYMLSYTKFFNQPLDKWNTSKVTNISCMFRSAASFNQNINSWNTSKVKYMYSIFEDASSFNQPLDNWNTSKVTDMSDVFRDAKSFNQNINSWNVSKVTNFLSMFRGAEAFNQPLDNWDVSKAKEMHEMFKDAKSFNQNIDEWEHKNKNAKYVKKTKVY